MPADAAPQGGWRPLAAPLALLLGWTLLGTAGFAAMGFPPFDALYMTVITLSTVGYGEIHPLGPGGRAFAMVLIVGGLGTALYALTRTGQMVIEGELLDVFGARRMRRAIGSIQDHYVVCGHGRTARPVVAALREEKIPFVVVDRDPEQARLLREEGILAVHGDATDEAVLEEAGLPRARGLLALLPSDADNLYLSMAAKGAREDVRVIARASDEKAEAKLRRVGADEVVLPYRIAGQRVLQAITQPHVVEFLDTLSRRAEMAMGLEEIRLGARSSLVGATLDEACRRERAGAIVVGLRRHGEALRFNPDRGERLQAGDVLLALGPPDDLRRLEALAADGAR